MAEPHDDGVRAAYREPQNDRDERRAQPDNELCYFPESDRQASPIGAVYGVLLPVLVAGVATVIFQSAAIGVLVGAALLAVVIAKLFLIDLSRIGSVERIVSFVGVGLLMLVVGYFSPLPPARESRS